MRVPFFHFATHCALLALLSLTGVVSASDTSSPSDSPLPGCSNHNDCCLPCNQCDEPPTTPSSAPSKIAKNLRYRHYAYDYRAPKAPASGSGCTTGCGGTFPTLPGLPALELERVHYEDTQLPSSLGVNWSFTQDVWLQVFPPGSIASGRPTGVPGWQVLVAKPMEAPIDFFVAVDGAGTGTFQDVKTGYFKSLQFFQAGGVLTADPSSATSAVFTEWTGETWTFEMFTEAPGTILGRPLRFADRNGNAIVHTWKYAVTDPALTGSLRSKLRIRDAITDAYGRSARFTYDETTQRSGQWVTTRIDLPNGQHLDYAYGNQDNPFAGTDGKLAQVTHPDGTISTFSMRVDAPKNCIVWTVSDPVAEPQSRFKQVWFSSATWVDPANPARRVGQIFGRVRQIVDGNGDITFQGGIQNVPDGKGGTESRTYYYTQNKLFAVVHQGGDRATATYERNPLSDGQPFFNPTADWSGWTKTFSITPGPASLTAGAFTDANGNAHSRTIDPATDSVLSQTYPDLSTSISERNGFQQITRAVDRAGRVTLTTFDAQGNRLSETRGAGTPDAGTWGWTYWTAADGATPGHGQPGQIRTATDARNNVTNYVYYPTGDLAQVVEPADVVGAPRATTTYVVDAAGRCTSVIDPANRLTQFGYDGLNRQVSALYADGSTELWAYPTTGLDAGLLSSFTDRNGHVTVYAHDGFGHTVATTRAAGTSVAVTDYTTFVPGNITTPNGQVNAGNAVTFQFDLRMRKVVEIRNTRGSTALISQFSYDDANLLRSSTDPFGRRTLRVYDVNDRVVRTVRELIAGGVPAAADLATLPRVLVANPPYVIEEAEYDASGLMTAQIDGRGNRREMVYDGQGRPAVIREAVGTAEVATMSTGYDPQGNVVDLTNARGFHTTATYSGRNLRLSQTEAVGTPVAATTVWTYTPTKKVATVTDALLRTTTNSYGVCCDRLVAIQDPVGFITTLAYDFYGNRTAMTDANGLPIITTYDARNRPSSVTNAAAETTVLTYTDDASALPEAAGLGLGAGAVGSSIATTNALNERSLEIRDGLGRTIRRVDGLGHATTLVYDLNVTDAGVPLVATSTTDPLAHTTSAYQDGAGRSRVMLDALGQRSTMGFDAAGNRITWRDANGVGMDCVFDARNRDVTCNDTAGAVTRKSYDANGNLVTETDALNKVATARFDERDRKTSATDRVLATTTFAYDAVSNLVRITDAEGGITDYRYESRNLLDREVFPAGQAGRTARYYGYDPGRRLTSRKVAAVPATGTVPATAPVSSEATAYAYDRANRLIARSYADALNDAFAYDKASRLTLATSARYTNRVSRSYDAASRLTTETLRFSSGAETGIDLPVAYGYDDGNRLTRLTYPDGSVVQRSYDARNLLNGIWDGGAAILTRAAADFDAGGRVVRSQFGNGLVEARGYVPGDNLVASIRIPGVTDFAYQYDADKRKTAEIDNLTANQSQRFAYDNQSRVTSWKRTGAAPADPALSAQTWTLSPVGDWKQTVTDGSTQNRTHTKVHELLTINGTTLGYDFKGNLTRDDQGQRFAWDQENRLRSATALVQSQGDVAQYGYDALGRRVKKTVAFALPPTSAAGVPPNPSLNVTTVFVSASAQEILEVTGELSAAPWLGGGDADPESVGASPFDPATGTGAVGSLLADPAAIRVNFQPATTDTPAGWLPDTGTGFVPQFGGQTFGWEAMLPTLNPQPTPIDRDRIGRPLYDTLGFLTRNLVIPQQWSIALPNGSYPMVMIVGDASSRVHTDSLVVNGQLLRDPTPWDGRLSNGYEEGQFDAITAQVQVTNGKLTIQPAWLGGALLPRINFIEIGKVGSTLDAATIARAKAAALKATQDTGKPKPKTPPVVKRNVWGSYVDELVSYTVKKPRKSPTRYYAHANSLYSVAAITSATGSVVERWSYNAYGVPTIKNSANATIAKSAVGNDRGFTGYKIDNESSLMYARLRMYSARLGRFVCRDMFMSEVESAAEYWFTDGLTPEGLRKIGARVDVSESIKFVKLYYFAGPELSYLDGYNLYSAYFIPGKLDPTGHQEESGEGETCKLPTELYCLYSLFNIPRNDSVGGAKSDGAGNELTICIACAEGSTTATPCKPPTVSNKLTVALDSGREISVPYGPASSSCTDCPEGAAKGSTKGNKITPKLPTFPKKPSGKTPPIPNPTGDPSPPPSK